MIGLYEKEGRGMISQDILSFLLTFHSEPVNVLIIYKFLKAYSKGATKVCLHRLVKHGYVRSVGSRKPRRYIVTSLGIEKLKHLQKRELLMDVYSELEKYLIMKDGGLD